MNQALITLVTGLVLGVKHAFEADHMVAVSTIVAREKNPLRAALVGAFWGLGHTTTLFIVGLSVFFLKISIPQNISLSLEFFVGIMLVLLGIRVIKNNQPTLHKHPHKHNQEKHSHLHFHSSSHKSHKHHESFLIGLIHGLAGSGALMILVLSTISDVLLALYYILILGLGSIIGMTLMSIILAFPFIYSTSKFPSIEKYLITGAGILSIILGVMLMTSFSSVFFSSFLSFPLLQALHQQ